MRKKSKNYTRFITILYNQYTVHHLYRSCNVPTSLIIIINRTEFWKKKNEIV